MRTCGIGVNIAGVSVTGVMNLGKQAHLGLYGGSGRPYEPDTPGLYDFEVRTVSPAITVSGSSC